MSGSYLTPRAFLPCITLAGVRAVISMSSICLTLKNGIESECHCAVEDKVKRLHAELEQATHSVPTSSTELSAAIDFSPGMEEIDISDPSGSA
jgi:hypothetical protein